MSIQKKSLISTLKTTKKANVASSELDAKPTSVNSKRAVFKNTKSMVRNTKSLKRQMASLKTVSPDFLKY